MALKKVVKTNNGIPLEYHRISRIDNIVNDKTMIIVKSYVNQEEREKEKQEQRARYFIGSSVFTYDDIIKIPYNDTLDIVSAYEYLKTTEKYKDAEDIFEEGDE